MSRKWRFWVVLVFVAAVVWYVYPFVTFQINQWYAEWKHGEILRAGEAWRAEQEALEEAYKNDEYGGATPEETLRLFVEALEAKDYELAAKYFVVEEQEGALQENRAGEQGGNQFFVNAYRFGRVIPPNNVGASGIYEIEVFPVEETVAFGIRLIKNEFTGKWKILEL